MCSCMRLTSPLAILPRNLLKGVDVGTRRSKTAPGGARRHKAQRLVSEFVTPKFLWTGETGSTTTWLPKLVSNKSNSVWNIPRSWTLLEAGSRASGVGLHSRGGQNRAAVGPCGSVRLAFSLLLQFIEGKIRCLGAFNPQLKSWTWCSTSWWHFTDSCLRTARVCPAILCSESRSHKYTPSNLRTVGSMSRGIAKSIRKSGRCGRACTNAANLSRVMIAPRSEPWFDSC